VIDYHFYWIILFIQENYGGKVRDEVCICGNIQVRICIRPISLVDEPFLWEMLYQALHVPEGAQPFPRDIVRNPDIRRYAERWGQPGDVGFVAVDHADQHGVGAAWIRMLADKNKGYGYIDDITPELSVAVITEQRGKGIGTQLLTRLLDRAQEQWSSVSLSVSSDNPAVRLYERMGFEVLRSNAGSLTMAKRFR
jgi:GNAT superfamily N-acetyltransferase